MLGLAPVHHVALEALGFAVQAILLMGVFWGVLLVLVPVTLVLLVLAGKGGWPRPAELAWLLVPAFLPLATVVVGAAFQHPHEDGDRALSVAGWSAWLLVPLGILVVQRLREHWPLAAAAMLWWTYYTLCCWVLALMSVSGDWM